MANLTVRMNVADSVNRETANYAGVESLEALGQNMFLAPRSEYETGAGMDFGTLFAETQWIRGDEARDEERDPVLLARVNALRSGDVELMDWETVKRQLAEG